MPILEFVVILLLFITMSKLNLLVKSSSPILCPIRSPSSSQIPPLSPGSPVSSSPLSNSGTLLSSSPSELTHVSPPSSPRGREQLVRSKSSLIISPLKSLVDDEELAQEASSSGIPRKKLGNKLSVSLYVPRFIYMVEYLLIQYSIIPLVDPLGTGREKKGIRKSSLLVYLEELLLERQLCASKF